MVYFATGASTVRVRARSPHASELLPGKSKSRSNNSCEVRAEGEQKPSGAVERASHDDARPTEQTAYTLKGINALIYFNSRAGEEKGGLEGKTPVLPSGVPRVLYTCIKNAVQKILHGDMLFSAFMIRRE